MISRRAFTAGALAALATASCSTRRSPRQVVVYSSVDAPILRSILEAFEREHAIRVLSAGDTEATKTTGLMQRALTDLGRVDVWWSNEAMATLRLADQGALAPFAPSPSSAWTRADPSGLWHAFSPRFRCFVFNPRRAADPPRTLADLASPAWRERLGLARPEFGTTRGLMGALLAAWGPDAFSHWAASLKHNRARLYDGNSSVVRACALGEIDAGLTDTDDVFAAQAQGWPVELAFEPLDPSASPPSLGALELPNTIALLRDAPHPDEARAFIDFALSEHVDRLLMQSESRNFPTRPALRTAYTHPIPADIMPVDLALAARLAPDAVEAFSRAQG